MLVLSRKSTERIQIGDNVVVTVQEIRGNKVRIGIAGMFVVHFYAEVGGAWLTCTLRFSLTR